MGAASRSSRLTRKGPVPGPARPLNLMPVPASVKFGAGRVPISTATTVALKGFVDDRLRAAVQRAMRRLEGRTGLAMSRAWAVDPAGDARRDVSGTGRPLPTIGEDESYTLDASATGRAARRHGRRRDSRPRDLAAARLRRSRRILLPGRRDPGSPAVSLARTADRRRPPLRTGGGHQARARRHGRRQAERPPLAPERGSGLPRREPQVSEAARARLRRRSTTRRIRFATSSPTPRSAASASCPSSTCPVTSTSWVVGVSRAGQRARPVPDRAAVRRLRRRRSIRRGRRPTSSSTASSARWLTLFPDPYWHIGGDENNGKQWEANPAIQSFMKAQGSRTPHALQSVFQPARLRILRKHGKRMMGWDEILQPGLPEGSRHPVVARAASHSSRRRKQGYDGVLSAGYYIDLMNPRREHYAVDPLPGGRDLTRRRSAHILGGEATMWGEWVRPETIDSRIWPRTAAIAERFWSPAASHGRRRHVPAAARGQPALEELGLTHERNGDVLLRRLTGERDVSILKVLPASSNRSRATSAAVSNDGRPSGR